MKEPILIHYYLLKSLVYADFLSFYLKSSLLGSHPAPCITFSQHVSLGSWPRPFLRLSFSLVTSVLRSTAQAFSRMLPYCSSSDVFVWLGHGCGFGKGSRWGFDGMPLNLQDILSGTVSSLLNLWCISVYISAL